MTRRRLDAEMMRRHLVDSRTAAQHLIASGRVTVRGMVATKPATQVEDSAPIEIVAAPEEDYVSRGAHKLIGALEAFQELIPSVQGQHCLDAGASTGGFTDVLLRRGAGGVIAVDVGYGQLAWRLREHPKVTTLERTNIRHLQPDQVLDSEGNPPTLVVSDLSFISLTKVIDNLAKCAPNALQILMVKPQFEVGKGKVGAGGVVRDPELRFEAVNQVAAFAHTVGLKVAAVAPSPLPGPAGNVEYFLLLAPPSAADLPELSGIELEDAIRTAIKTGPQEGTGKQA